MSKSDMSYIQSMGRFRFRDGSAEFTMNAVLFDSLFQKAKADREPGFLGKPGLASHHARREDITSTVEASKRAITVGGVSIRGIRLHVKVPNKVANEALAEYETHARAKRQREEAAREAQRRAERKEAAVEREKAREACIRKQVMSNVVENTFAAAPRRTLETGHAR